jgi:DNA modification methylase
METNVIHNVDCLEGLKTLPDNSIDCCVTSPPYYGLRDYGTATWEGGDQNCKHSEREEKGFENQKQSSIRGNSKPPKSICNKCGAIRIDKQIGLERSPEEYISRLLEVFTEVFRVLKYEGTLWVNIGDSYAGSGRGKGDVNKKGLGKKAKHIGDIFNKPHELDGYKNKDLIGIPWMLAFALRNAGWYLRQDIIWHKPNPMPEPIKDRCTKAHEYIFLLSKSKRYYFDHEAIKEPQSLNTHSRYSKLTENGQKDVPVAKENSKESKRPGYKNYRKYTPKTFLENGRNKRSVWTVGPSREPESHFACFPQKLITDCIKAGCPEEGIVLDPFMGSATTAVVALKLNRNYVGFELNRDYIELSKRKITRELENNDID